MAINPKGGLTALTRFAFGARGDGDLAAASTDPRGFLEAELRQPGIALLDGPGLKGSAANLRDLFAEQEQKRVASQKAPPMDSAPLAEPNMAPMSDGMRAVAPVAKQTPTVDTLTYRAEAYARFRRAVDARVGFVERLVCFWSNHFCVSASKSAFVRAAAGSFEREAIRPHVLGRFADMLRSVEQHQAMVYYLDNQQSIGLGSKIGRFGKHGLNENLAREIMELHTLGVDGGYTQADVTAFARVITGWTAVGPNGRALGEPGTSAFAAAFHEPGPQQLLGHIYRDEGRAQGLAVLDDLARSPATAHHLALKFARHFVSDDPPAALVTRLERNFIETEGDLLKLALTLISSPEPWVEPPVKIRSPYEFLVAAARATDQMLPDAKPLILSLRSLGQPLWEPPGPNGFPDTANSWLSPVGVKARLDTSWQIVSRILDVPDPLDVLQKVVGPASSAETRDTLSRAETRQQALTLLLMSSEMQRR